MNKAAIKKYAVTARCKLIDAVTQKMRYYGFEEKHALSEKEILQKLASGGVYLDESQMKARAALSSRIQAHGFHGVAEEVAYTWFNRLAALRFMEANGYLPSGIRILSSGDNNRLEPECIRSWGRLEFINKMQAEKAKAQGDEALYRYILVKQCNELAKIMPGMFSAISDYTELLLPDRLYSKGGIVYDLTHSEIEESDFGEQVEIIGWLYQYYISGRKNEVFAALKKNVKITKENIPAATQLFTPNWIVRYMVENSLGRLWLEGHPNNELLQDWKYFLPDTEQIPEVEAEQRPEVEAEIDKIRRVTRNIKPEEIKLIDPCMGSGHILVYAFDVLYQIYKKHGYAERDIPDLILKNNIFGLDIDERACQLTYFALMMKARSYNRRFFRRDPELIPQPQVYATVLDSEAAVYSRDMGDFLLDKTYGTKHQETFDYLITAFRDIEEYGSLIKLEQRDYTGLLEAWNDYADAAVGDLNMTLWYAAMGKAVPDMIKRAILLTQKYDVVVTNPPYMGANGMGARLAQFVKKNYPDSKSDLFAVFIERCGEMLKPNGFQAMITQHAWMFLSGYEKLRTKLLQRDIINMAHLGARAFAEIGGEVVQTTAFVMSALKTAGYKATYVRLVDFGSQSEKEDAFLSGEHCHLANTENFEKIPGSPIAYWASKQLLSAFSDGIRIKANGDTRQGMATSDNKRFLRFWQEVNINRIGFGFADASYAIKNRAKWIPYNKGGTFRKWYGNSEYVINYENDGFEVKQYAASLYKSPTRTIKSISEYFKQCISWSKVNTVNIAFRFYPYGYIFDVAGCCIFYNDESVMNYHFAFLNSRISKAILSIISPTMNYEAGHIASLPILGLPTAQIDELVVDNIALSRADWDSFETSWDFKRHPLIHGVHGKIKPSERNTLIHEMLEGAFQAWERECEERFQTLKRNEEELNRIFIDIYDLQDELTPEVDDKDVTVRRADLGREIRSLISYAVGCMFGRYSLDVEGLAYAGGDWDASKYKSFIHSHSHYYPQASDSAPSLDNILPITDADYFNNDIVLLFVEFVRIVYGEGWLENNLHFIAETLYPNASGTARDKIRRYFLNDFYKDHIKIYQKRPIYWQFDSAGSAGSKQAGFKALIYLHRYDKHTVGRVRTEYLHPLQRKYEAEIERLNELTGLPGTSARDKADSRKRVEILRKKIDECREYDLVIAHIAVQSIELDLDDGVTMNYARFQGIEIAQSGGRPPVKMNLLTKF